MKLIIDIPEEEYFYIKKSDETSMANWASKECMLNAIKNGAVIEKQPCEDCISRQEAISAIQDEYYAHAVGIDIVDIIAHLPPVQPTRPTGHWIAGVDRWGDIVTTVNGYRCSECCAFNADKDNYCPNCGAKMNGVETEVEDDQQGMD